MPPKFIIIKIQSKIFYKLLVRELTNQKNLFFFTRKINGVYTICIKCQKYYDWILSTINIDVEKNNSSSIYLSYIYLYTCVSMILSELIINFFEDKITNQILNSKYKYLPGHEFMRFSNIAHIVLDSNFPSKDSKKLYVYRKDLILNRLLFNFRNRNYNYVEHFAFFKLNDYHNHLEYIIEKTYSRY